MKIKLIYLAAGNSRRFNSQRMQNTEPPQSEAENKLLYLLGEKPMFRYLFDRLVKVCQRHPEWEMIVVTQYPEIEHQVKALQENAFGADDKRFSQCGAGHELPVLLGGQRVVQLLERMDGLLGRVACRRAVRSHPRVADQPFGREADFVAAGNPDPHVEVFGDLHALGKQPHGVEHAPRDAAGRRDGDVAVDRFAEEIRHDAPLGGCRGRIGPVVAYY